MLRTCVSPECYDGNQIAVDEMGGAYSTNGAHDKIHVKMWTEETTWQLYVDGMIQINPLTPNVNYSGRTAPLTSKVEFYIFIQQI